MPGSDDILVADVGGTKTLAAVVRRDPSGLTVTASQRYANDEHAGLAALLRRFLDASGAKPERACFAIAAPVTSRRVTLTNRDWHIDADALGAQLLIPRVELINDFAAVALGVPQLAPSGVVTLQTATTDPNGPIAVLGAGTGLGEALLVRTGADWRVVATEGGHTDFGPTNAAQRRLLEYLSAKFDHVSVERVCSGIAFPSLYAFARDVLAVQPCSDADRATADDAAALGAVLGDHAVRNHDAACVAVMQLFVDIYGAEAGNVALKSLARGGVFVAGGIAPRILPLLTDGRFARAFCAKGRYAPLMSTLPLHIVVDPHVALLGAAAAAAGA